MWILVMGVPSAVSAFVVGLLLGSPPSFALTLALTFGALLGGGTYALNRLIGDRDRRS